MKRPSEGSTRVERLSARMSEGKRRMLLRVMAGRSAVTTEEKRSANALGEDGVLDRQGKLTAVGKQLAEIFERDQRALVRSWMMRNLSEYDNATNLAEAAAREADGDNDRWLDDEQHWVWEIAGELKPAE